MRLVIVGGVAGGMSAAARARRLDEHAEIIVLERGPYVSFANCGLPYYVGGEITDRDSLLLHTPETLKSSLNLDVRINHDVTAIDADAKTVTVTTPDGVETLSYDSLVLSPGASAARPPIAGLDSPRVSTLRTVDDATTLAGAVDGGATTAVVLGAGFIGLEAAEGLAHRGLKVTLVEAFDHVLPPLETEMAQLVSAELSRLGIDVREGVLAKEIEHGAANDTVVLSDGSQVEADIVVLSAGVRPDTSSMQDAGIETDRGAILVDEHGRTNLTDVYAVGDATVSVDGVTGVKRPVALAGPANRAGRLVADFIFAPETAREIPSALGTAIVRAGHLTAAMTGANRKALADAGIEFHTLHLHPAQHAGYFPGAESIAMLVHIRAEDGLVLGAQAVGREGVDKRIDVLATAIRNRMVAEDLMDLDLSYSPPYGQAKDPVNLVGMIGENVLNGTLKLWYADEIEQVAQTALLLDVRSDAEVAQGSIPGALAIPHTELRERIDEVREAAAGRPVRVFCAAGQRSHLAHRVLSQEGFDSASLSGGWNTLVAVLTAMQAAAARQTSTV